MARDSRVLIHAEKDGVVDYVDSKEVHVKYKYNEEDGGSFDSNIKSISLN